MRTNDTVSALPPTTAASLLKLYEFPTRVPVAAAAQIGVAPIPKANCHVASCPEVAAVARLKVKVPYMLPLLDELV